MARYWRWTATVVCMMVVMQSGAATQFKVGGNRGGWVSSPGPAETYNQWAERNRFIIGDSIVFTYNSSLDSVLEVTKQDYDSCTTSNPMQSYKDGNTVFTFPKHGPFYFISGNATSCQQGQKVVIVVLSPRNQRGKGPASPAPAPTVASSPPPVAPSPAPSTVVSPPSPAPSTVAAPTPTPSGPSPVVSPVASPAVSPTVASVPSEAAVPAMAPGNPSQELSSPAPAPLVSEGGVVPSRSAGDGVRPRCGSAALALLALAAAF